MKNPYFSFFPETPNGFTLKKLAFLLLLGLLCLNFSCRDDDDTPEPQDPHGLPFPTQTGENTFGCLVNGEPWVAEIGLEILDPTLRPLDMRYDETEYGNYANNSWGGVAKLKNDSISDSFVFGARQFEHPVSLNRTDHFLRFIHHSNRRSYVAYELDTLQPYQVEITKLDTINNICAGTFEFYVLSTDKSDTLHITKGRFDKKYNPE